MSENKDFYTSTHTLMHILLIYEYAGVNQNKLQM